MDFKKTLTAAAVGAVTAGLAVPALALENEFHGMFLMRGIVSTIENGGGGQLRPLKDAPTNNYFEHRARLQYTAKASDDLKLVTQFELDTRWGGITTGKYAGTSDAGVVDSDGVSLETKHVYLDFKVPGTPMGMKVGTQAFTDAYSGVFLNGDVSGIAAQAKYGMVTPRAFFFRINENQTKVDPNGTGVTPLGRFRTDVYGVDTKVGVAKDVNVGGGYYHVSRTIDRAANGTVGSATSFGYFDPRTLHMVGVNADGKFGPATVSGFFTYQFGDFDDAQQVDLKAYAAGAIARIKAGPGTAKVSAVYLSGDDVTTDGESSSFENVYGVNTFVASDMFLLMRTGRNNSNSAGAMTWDMTMGGRGLMGVFAGYDLPINQKLSVGANVGYAQVAEDEGLAGKSLGTEVNATVAYKLYDNLTVSLNGAHVFVGDLYNGILAQPVFRTVDTQEEADDVYTYDVRLSYT